MVKMWGGGLISHSEHTLPYVPVAFQGIHYKSYQMILQGHHLQVVSPRWDRGSPLPPSLNVMSVVPSSWKRNGSLWTENMLSYVYVM